MSNAAANLRELPVDDWRINQTMTPSNSGGSQQSGLIDFMPAGSSRPREATVSTTEDATDNNPELEERRVVIGKAVESRLGVIHSFAEMLEKFQLREQFENFQDVPNDIFLDIAERSLVFSHGGFRRVGSQEPYQNKKSALVDHFTDIHQEICNTALQSLKGSCYEKSPYAFHFSQNSLTAGSNIRPDGLFCFWDGHESYSTAHIVLEAKKASYGENIPPSVLGQLGDYAMAVWREQPLRTFIPVMLLHGETLDVFIFTRSEVYRARVGQIGVSDSSGSDASVIAETFWNLWFILTLPAGSFGHISHVDSASSRIKVTSNRSGSARVEISVDFWSDHNILSFKQRIQKTVRIFGRLTHLYRSSYQGKSVVAKVSWSPVDSLPECAMYEALQTAGVPGVPKVIDHGVIQDDLFGYRAELLLLEDCGMSIGAYFAKRGRIANNRSAREGELAEYTKQVATTLVRAYDSGILNRDISNDNITIKNKRAYLIDWGYAKFLPWADIGELTRRWGFEDGIPQNEDTYDLFIGTPQFMSVQTLLGAAERNIMNDLESLFMVVLHSLVLINGLDPDSDDPNYAWKFLSNEMTATLRLGCLCSAEKYLQKFNCGVCGPLIKPIVDSLYQVLFVEDEIFLGNKLVMDTSYKRRFNAAAAAVFMGDDNSRLLQNHLVSSGDACVEVQEASLDTTTQIPARHKQPDTPALPAQTAAKSKVPAAQTRPLRNLHIRSTPRLRSNKVPNKDIMGIADCRVPSALGDPNTHGQTTKVARPESGMPNRSALARLARPTEASARRAASRPVVSSSGKQSKKPS